MVLTALVAARRLSQRRKSADRIRLSRQVGLAGARHPAVAADMRWPFIGELAGGTQTLTPRVQIVATPPLKNLDIPNEKFALRP